MGEGRKNTKHVLLAHLRQSVYRRLTANDSERLSVYPAVQNAVMGKHIFLHISKPLALWINQKAGL